MAEITLKIDKGSGYEDGDVIHAHTDKHIGWCHCQMICHPWKNGLTNQGLRPGNTHVQAYYEAVYQYKFVRQDDKVIRFDLWNGGFETFGKPDIDVKLFIDRRRKRKDALAPDGGPKLAIFGVDGAEIWYGGRQRNSQQYLNQVWDAIESYTSCNRHEDRHKKMPMGNQDCRSHLRIKVNNMTDNLADFLSQPALFSSATNPDSPMNMVLKRSSFIRWKDLPDLDRGIIKMIPDKILPVDIRDINFWFHEEVVLEKGIGKMVDLKTLKAEVTNDPLGRGYSSMTDAEVAASLNTGDRTFNRKIGSRELMTWAAQNSRWANVDDAADNKALPNSVRSIAMASRKLLDRQDAELDMSTHSPMIDALVAAGILTAGDKTELLALSTKAGSRAEELGLDEVFESHVTYVRAN